jgi:predicted nucleotidyltransferase
MTNISLDLSSKLPAGDVSIIRRIVHTAASQNLNAPFIVGAQARDLILQYAYRFPVRRATEDIDFGIVVENWDEFIKLREALVNREGFQLHPARQQRLLHEEGAIVDLVPFGDVEERAGVIAWPPDFSVMMSTVGFREAYGSSIDVRVADDLVVKVASLAGLALLKIVAWFDRRYDRDAEDIGLIMRHYLDAGNQNRLYSEGGDCSDLLLEETFEYEAASARILGRDVAQLLTSESRTVIEQVLSDETEDAVTRALAMAMVRNNANYHGDFDVALAMLSRTREGVTEIRGSL